MSMDSVLFRLQCLEEKEGRNSRVIQELQRKNDDLQSEYQCVMHKLRQTEAVLRDVVNAGNGTEQRFRNLERDLREMASKGESIIGRVSNLDNRTQAKENMDRLSLLETAVNVLREDVASHSRMVTDRNLATESESSSASGTASGPHPSSSVTLNMQAPDASLGSGPVKKSRSGPIGVIASFLFDRKRKESDSRTTTSRKELKDIQRKSMFHARMSRANSFPIPKGPTPTKMVGYGEDCYDSPYWDSRTGSYGVPVKGRYGFGVVDMGVVVDGEVEWFVCRGDGRREKMTGRRVCGWYGYEYDIVQWECEEGEDVWVEGVGVGQDVRVKGFWFYGRLLLD